MKSSAVIFVVFGIVAMILAKPQGEEEYNSKTCPRRCSEQYYPVCGVNKADENCVFVNECYMAMENCAKPEEKVYHKADPAKCPEYAEWVDKDWNSNTV